MGAAWSFVGRSQELARADELLSSGLGVLIMGEPGIGKSALARRIAQRARATGRRASMVDGRPGAARMPYEPFAAVVSAGLGATADGVSAPYEVARRIAAAIGPGAVLVVDDAHLLDDASARVLTHLAGAATLVLTVNSTALLDAPLPADVERLWRGGYCERFDLDGLTGAEVAEALREVLGGAVDPQTVRTFVRRSLGNPLLLRELVLAAQRAGALEHADGIWMLHGEPPLSRGLRDLVAARLGDLDEHLTMGLELIAAGEPLDGDLAAELVAPAVLEELERLRLIAVRESLGVAEVSTAHPLYGEVIRHRTPRLRLRRLRLDLACRIEKQPAAAPYDIVRAGLWRLEVGQASDGNQLLAAARAARGFGLDVAERLARSAYEASGSVDATLLLAEILTHRGRPAEAAALIAPLPPDCLSAADRDAVVYVRAMGEGLMTGNSGGAADVIAGVLAGDGMASDLLRGMHVALLAFDARFRESLEVAGGLADDPDVAPLARLFAGLGSVGSLYWIGRLGESVEFADRMRELDLLAREAVPFAIASAELVAVCALADLGDLDAADARALDMRDLSGGHAPFAMPRADYCLGRVALLRGRLGAARRYFEMCGATLAPFDRIVQRHLASLMARTAAAGGDVPAARAALAAAEGLPKLLPYEAEWQLAEAAVLAADLRLPEAADLAAWVAGVGAARGAWTVVVAACLDAARYGAAARVRDLVREAAAHVDGRLAPTCAAYVEALCRRDGAALDASSAGLAACGMMAVAAEAAAEASLAHADAGQPRASRASARAFAALRGACDGAVFPWLSGATGATPLTARERQVAWLASRGSTDREIARRLGISVRTVGTHLTHVYDKLGIRRRSDLPAAIS